MTDAGLEGQWLHGGSMDAGQVTVERLLVRVPLVRPGQDLHVLVRQYLLPGVRQGDTAFVSEKVVSITQGRAVGMWQVTPRPLARLISRFVHTTPHGRGIGQPVVMEMAFREVGAPRIVFAALVGGLTRAFGHSGDFYRIAGRRVAAIDGPNRYTVKPFGYYIILAPEKPDRVAEDLSRLLGIGVAVVDCNDLGSEVLGASDGVDREFVREALRDNPMGQRDQRTPMGLLRIKDR